MGDFDAKKDEVYWVEVVSERLGVPTNPYFRLERVTKNDQGEESVSTVKEVQDSPVNIGGASFDTTSGILRSGLLCRPMEPTGWSPMFVQQWRRQ